MAPRSGSLAVAQVKSAFVFGEKILGREAFHDALNQLMQKDLQLFFVGVSKNDINQRDARELFRRMVCNILVDNTDDHEKNHSLLVVNPIKNGSLKLAPAYMWIRRISLGFRRIADPDGTAVFHSIR